MDTEYALVKITSARTEIEFTGSLIECQDGLHAVLEDGNGIKKNLMPDIIISESSNDKEKPIHTFYRVVLKEDAYRECSDKEPVITYQEWLEKRKEKIA